VLLPIPLAEGLIVSGPFLNARGTKATPLTRPYRMYGLCALDTDFKKVGFGRKNHVIYTYLFTSLDYFYLYIVLEYLCQDLFVKYDEYIRTLY
jgi:hypothetical protein